MRRIGMLTAVAGMAAVLVTGCGQGNVPPQQCQVQATAGKQLATTVQPGDAGWYWVPQMHSYQEFVCTDGTLVHVTGYGN